MAITLTCILTDVYRCAATCDVDWADKSVTLTVSRVELTVYGDENVSVSAKVRVGNTTVWDSGSKSYSPGSHTATPKKTFTVEKGETSSKHYVYLDTSGGGGGALTNEGWFTTGALADKYVKPSKKVTSLAVKRNGSKYDASWKVPSQMTKESSVNRYTGIQAEWGLDMAGSTASVYDDDYLDASANSNSQSFGEFKGNFKPFKGKSLSRSAFYPETSQKLSSIFLHVRGYHKRDGGTVVHGDWAGPAKVSFSAPRKPSVSWSYDTANSTATVTVKTDAGTDNRERRDTMVRVTIVKKNGKTATLKKWASTTKTEWTASYDLSSYIGGFAAGDSVSITAEAYARGLAGDSATASATRKVAYPAAAAVKSFSLDKKAASGRLKVVVSPGKNTGKVQLQRRHGKDGSWQDVSGATDDGDCKALYDSYGDAAPVKGEYLYYRVKSTRDNYTTYGSAKRADCMYTAKPVIACTATLTPLVVTPSKNGSSASVAMAWKDSTDNHGLELSWSDDPDAWKSGSGPNTETYARGAATGKETVKLTGLSAGKSYWLRYRRYRDKDGKRYFGDYSATAKIVAPTAENDRCGIISVTPNADATSLRVVVGYTEDTANTGTELSWSTSSGAWSSSSERPSTSEYTATGTASTNKSWAKQVTLSITGLDPGATYYVKARRYLDRGGVKTYTPYSTSARVACESAEDDVCKVDSCVSEPSGTGAVLTVLISEDNANTGTEVAWSTDRFAMRSNEQPSTMQATWGTAASGDPSFPKKQVSYLRGLEPGTSYYVWARRYLVAGSSTTYGGWSKEYCFKTAQPAVDTAANDECAIVSSELTEDGRGATVVVGWNEDNANDLTELSWSDDSGAWTSNDGPSTMEADWEDDESQSDGYARTQTVNLRGLSLGTTYFIRARRHLSEDGSYSPYSNIATIRTPGVAGDPDVRCGIVSLEPLDDGTSAVCVVGWSGDRTGCELSWSDDPDAWESSEQPKSAKFEWADGESASESWNGTARFYIRDLEQGVTCYVKARSYYDGEDTVWSDYTEAELVTPYSAPASVVLSAPSAIARGESIELYWTVEHELDQAEWSVHLAGEPNASLDNGTGSLCHASIAPERYGDAESISLYVSAGCGGGMTDSGVVEVAIADVPALDVACAGTLGSQPASFEACTSDPTSRLLVTCTSQGVTQEAPDGDRDQLAGVAVWTGVVQPSWTESTWGETLVRSRLSDDLEAAQEALADMQEGDEGYDDAVTALADAQAALDAHPADGAVYVMQVDMPPTLDLVDGGTYTVQAQAVEHVAGLASPARECAFAVEWSHQALEPSEAAELTVDEDGRSVTVTLTEPDGWEEGDLLDLYRMTPTGHVLVARDLVPGAEVVDPFAPFGTGELHYRLAWRTSDGDLAYSDFEYALDVQVLRFDWPGGYVELPYNIKLSDGYKKDFEARAHEEGVEGYYNRSVVHTGSYDAVVEKADSDTLERLRTLAEHPGAVFCRAADGRAFQCNADVDALDLSYASGIAGASFPITEIRLTRPYMAHLRGDDE